MVTGKRLFGVGNNKRAWGQGESEGMAAVSLRGLVKRYGAVTAVAGIDLEIAEGEFIVLLGPSGCGKTTTLRCIAGLEDVSEGEIRMGDQLVSAAGFSVPPEKRDIGMVFQSYAIWPHMSVAENVAFGLKMKGLSGGVIAERVKQALDLVGLSQFGDRGASQLSGGQQQRVALARALVAEPDVILFDEPLSNLDAQLRESMRGLLADLHRELRITSVYVTHDQAEAMVLSDRVHVMDKGRLIQAGTPVEIYERPASLFVASFIGQANSLKAVSVDRATSRVTLAGGSVIEVGYLPTEIRENAVIIRPHQITFAAESDTANVLQGVVRTAYYLGDRARFEIRTPAADLIVELLPEVARPTVGDNVRLRLPALHCMVL